MFPFASYTHILQLLSETLQVLHLNGNQAAAEEASKEPITRESQLRCIYTCCKAGLYCRHRTGAFTFTVSHQWGGEVH